MATYTPEDLITQDLSCPICFEDYSILYDQRAPKLLLCLHTFCFGCAQRLWQRDGTLECSLCRTVHSGVALNELFDNPVIFEHLRRKCEEQDLEFARRLDREMRNRASINSESTTEVIDLTTPREEQRNEERRILNRAPPPPPPPVRGIVQADDDDNEEEDGDDIANSGHSNMFDSDGTVEDEDEDDDDEEEEEEDGSDNDGQIDDFINNHIDEDVADALEDIEDAVNGIEEDVTDAMEEMEDAVNGIEEVADAMEEMADAVNGLGGTIVLDDTVSDVEEPCDCHHPEDPCGCHPDEDDSTSSSDDNADEDEEAHDDSVRQMMVTIPWINHLHAQSDEEENEGRDASDDCIDHEEEGEDDEEEEEEEDRWHSASDEVTIPPWVDDDFSMDDDAPESPLIDWLIL